MLLNTFRFIFSKLIGKVDPQKKERALDLFGELVGILAYNASRGTAEGLKNGK